MKPRKIGREKDPKKVEALRESLKKWLEEHPLIIGCLQRQDNDVVLTFRIKNIESHTRMEENDLPQEEITSIVKFVKKLTKKLRLTLLEIKQQYSRAMELIFSLAIGSQAQTS